MGRTRWAVTRRKACRYGSRGSDGWPDGKVDPVSAAMEKGFGPWKTAGKIQRHQAGLQGGFPLASALSHSCKAEPASTFPQALLRVSLLTKNSSLLNSWGSF